jgi:hypothetical protein
MAGRATNRRLMISAQFRIELPDWLWVAELSRAFPEATFRLLSGVRADERAIELGEVVTDSPAAVLDAFHDHSALVDPEALEQTDERLLVKYATTDTALYEFAEMASLTVEFPIDVRRGWYEFDLTGTREELDQLQAVLDGSGLSYELLSLVGREESDDLLTDRQREVLEAAVHAGYFEVPRDCTLADIADDLDVDKSTASTVLRRGQSRLVRQYLTGPGGTGW